MKHVLQNIQTSVLTLWNSREPRERRLMAGAAAVLLLGGLYNWVLDPALRGMARLKTSLPNIQAQAVQVQQLAAQLQAKNGGEAGAGNGVNQGANHGVNGGVTGKHASSASIQAALAQAGIQAKVSSAAPWVITVDAAAGDALWAWLKSHSASRSQLKRNANGSWQGDITLEP